MFGDWMALGRMRSRNRTSGNVPNVNFNPVNRQVNVNADWYNVSNHNPKLRVRLEV